MSPVLTFLLSFLLSPLYFQILSQLFSPFPITLGGLFPRDPLRPICNLAHSKLLIAVDWEDSPSTLSQLIRNAEPLIGLGQQGYNPYLRTSLLRLPPYIDLESRVKLQSAADEYHVNIMKRTNQEQASKNGSAVGGMGTNCNNPDLNMNQQNSLVIPNGITIEDCLKVCNLMFYFVFNFTCVVFIIN